MRTNPTFIRPLAPLTWTESELANQERRPEKARIESTGEAGVKPQQAMYHSTPGDVSVTETSAPTTPSVLVGGGG